MKGRDMNSKIHLVLLMGVVLAGGCTGTPEMKDAEFKSALECSISQYLHSGESALSDAEQKKLHGRMNAYVWEHNESWGTEKLVGVEEVGSNLAFRIINVGGKYYYGTAINEKPSSNASKWSISLSDGYTDKIFRAVESDYTYMDGIKKTVMNTYGFKRGVDRYYLTPSCPSCAYVEVIDAKEKKKIIIVRDLVNDPDMKAVTGAQVRIDEVENIDMELLKRSILLKY